METKSIFRTPLLNPILAAFTATTLSLASVPAMAGGITLSRAMKTATLGTGGIDMVVFYIMHERHLEVVATYAIPAILGAAARLRLEMLDGDSVAFSVPGAGEVTYGFARDGEAIHVSAQPAEPADTADQPMAANIH
ncbi:MAG: hypothetical protein AAGC57_07255 [Pseudomonadota bacterium]